MPATLPVPHTDPEKAAARRYVEALVDEVSRLLPVFLADPIEKANSRGNAVVSVIGPDGFTCGRIFGDDAGKGRWCHGIASRKVIQVWRTGYATGLFESKIYAGELNESDFGVDRPDFIGWLGGVPLLTAEGWLIAAAFSGFRGEKDVEIIERAATAVSGLVVKRA